MQDGRVVVVKDENGMFVIGQAVNVASDGMDVQFVKDGPLTHFTKESGQVHKIRDNSIEDMVRATIGVGLASQLAYEAEHSDDEDESEGSDSSDDEDEDYV